MFSEPKVELFDDSTQREKGRGFYYKGAEYVHHSELPHHETAFFRLSSAQKVVLLGIGALLLIGLIINWYTTVVLFTAVLTFLYFIDLLFNFFLIYQSFSKSPQVKVTAKEIIEYGDDWPVYTVMCPLYKEWGVIPQFIEAIKKLDYPKDKLQVILLLEQDDEKTIEYAQTHILPEYFDTVVIPHSNPKTKPKALNFGMLHTKGEYAVIYDAEDVPDELQLKKAVVAFNKVSDRVRCIQAKLNFYNPRQNILTRVFTAEYSLWFDLVLTGLQSIHAPIPLGGTSNHFRVEDLRMLKGWDAFNVTEDADLGMRLVKRGYRTAIIDSDTQEEANSSFKNWFWQRTRWIKGYMQTYLVHMRHPGSFIRHWREPHVVTFQLVVGGKVASMLINPFMWIITISYFVFRPIIGPTIESFYPAPILYMGLFALIIGNFLYMYYYMIGCAKRDYDDIIKYAFLVPFYWLYMSMAAWTAVYLLIVKPHHWSKTQHGLHLNKTEKDLDKILQNPAADLKVIQPSVN